MGDINLSYQGNVTIRYFINGKEVKYKTHNEGLNAMFQYICKILSGNLANIASDAPAYADIRCVYSDVETKTEVSKSCLYNTLSLSDKGYDYDTVQKCWYTRYSIVLSYTMLNFEVIDEHADDNFYVYIISQSNKEFARISLDSKELDLYSIIPGTQALIEWKMIIKNA